MNLKIGVGIVLYNPDINLLEKNINALYKQADKILLFDNGSKNYELIKKLSSKYNNMLLKGVKQNQGIAFALNRIVDWAQAENYKWVLSMDQDSICSPNLLKEYSYYLNNKDIALICPFVLNNGKVAFEEYKKLNLPPTTLITDPVKCITSACLMNVKLVREVGSFNEKLFIDCVDIDLNCRVLEAGKKILQVNSAYMIQQMGKGKKIKLFEYLQHLTGIDLFRRSKVIAVYSNKRLYYYSRNSRYIRKKYKNHGKQMSWWFISLYFTYFTIFYPLNRNRVKMWKAMFKGFKDSYALDE